MMKVVAGIAAAALLWALSADAQVPSTSTPLVVSACGTLPTGVSFAAGQNAPPTVDTTGRACGSPPATTNNVGATPHICGNHVFKHITTATDTQLVAASGSTNIYVCDYSFSFGGAGNFFLEKATTGTCATLTQLTGQWYGAASSGKTDANPYYRGVSTGASAQLCVNTSTFTGPLDIDVYYDQY
jgi:hypothetical protein